MSRSTLTQNYLVQSGTLFEEFGTVGDWTVSGAGGSIQADTTNTQSGGSALRVDFGSTAVSVTKTISTTAFSKMRTVTLYIYIEDIAKINQSLVTTLFISSSSTFTNNYSWRILASRFRTGWNKVVIPKSEFVLTGSESWSNTMIRMRVRCQAASGQTTWMTFDKLVIDEYQLPQVLFTFDNSLASQYTEAYSRLAAKNIKGSVQYRVGNVGGAGYLTVNQIGTMYDNGWDVVPTGTSSMGDLTSVDEATEDLTVGISTVQNLGYTRGEADRHVFYIDGVVNSFSDGAFDALNLLSGRTLQTSSHGMTPLPIANVKRLKTAQIINTTTYATVKGYIDNAVANGQGVILVFNSLVTTPTTASEWALTDFQTLVDYVSVLESRGYITTKTITEFWKGFTDPRYRSLPLSRSVASTRTVASNRTVVS